jgi:hypothetical protein
LESDICLPAVRLVASGVNLLEEGRGTSGTRSELRAGQLLIEQSALHQQYKTSIAAM